MEVILAIAGSCVLIYFFLVAFLYYFQESLLFQGKPLPKDHSFNFNFAFEERTYHMEDGAEVHGIFIPAKEEKGVILYAHGNTGTVARWAVIAQYFTRYGYSVLVYDYRGYGKSSGKRTMQTLFNDALFIYKDLLERYDASHIVIYGRSLGSGIATWLASNTNSKALILETPFYSISETAALRLLIIPTSWFLKFPFPSYRFIKDVKSPIHIIHGTRDLVVPYASGKKLFRKSPNDHHNSFTTIHGGRHNNLVEYEAFDELMNKVLD